MAGDVEDVSQSIADSGGKFHRKIDDRVTLTELLHGIYFSKSLNIELSTNMFSLKMYTHLNHFK